MSSLYSKYIKPKCLKKRHFLVTLRPAPLACTCCCILDKESFYNCCKIGLAMSVPADMLCFHRFKLVVLDKLYKAPEGTWGCVFTEIPVDKSGKTQREATVVVFYLYSYTRKS